MKLMNLLRNNDQLIRELRESYGRRFDDGRYTILTQVFATDHVSGPHFW